MARSRKFYTHFNKDDHPKYDTGRETKTDPYQFTPTDLLFAQSLQAGAMAKINQMNNFLYAENENVESDDISPIGVYPPDIAEAYQSVRFYKEKIKNAQRVYEESLKTSKKVSIGDVKNAPKVSPIE